MDFIEFEYALLEAVRCDPKLVEAFSREIAVGNLDLDRIGWILKRAGQRANLENIRKRIDHIVRHQLLDGERVLREIGCQNVTDAYDDLTTHLLESGGHIEYPLRIEVSWEQNGPNLFDVSIRDWALGMILHDVLFKLLSIGDTTKMGKENQYGGHGIGFKPALEYSHEVTIESHGGLTRAWKDGEYSNRPSSPASPNRYTLRIGEKSDIFEGTKITLKGLVLNSANPTDFFSKVGTYQTEGKYLLTVNGEPVSGNSETKGGRIKTYRTKEEYDYEDRKISVDVSLRAVDRSSAEEVFLQGGWVGFKRPSRDGMTQSTFALPSNVLLPRTRENIPGDLEESITGKMDGIKTGFYYYLKENISSVNAYEWRFLKRYRPSFGRVIRDILQNRNVRTFNSFFFFPFILITILTLGLYPIAHSIQMKLGSSRSKVAESELDGNASSTIHKPRISWAVDGAPPFLHFTPKKVLYLKSGVYDILLPDGTWAKSRERFHRISSTDSPLLEMPQRPNVENRGRNFEFEWKVQSRKGKIVVLMPFNSTALWFGLNDSQIDEIYVNKLGEMTVEVGRKFDGQVRYNVLTQDGNGDRIYEPEELTEAQFHKYTQVPFDIAYPAEIFNGLNSLYGLDSETQVEAVEDYLKNTMLYSTSRRTSRVFKNSQMNIVDTALKYMVGDCDVANTVLAAIVRDQFEIPTRLVVGYRTKPGTASPPGHGWIEAYIPGMGWRIFDASGIRTKEGPWMILFNRIRAVYNDFIRDKLNYILSHSIGYARENLYVSISVLLLLWILGLYVLKRWDEENKKKGKDSIPISDFMRKISDLHRSFTEIFSPLDNQEIIEAVIIDRKGIKDKAISVNSAKKYYSKGCLFFGEHKSRDPEYGCYIVDFGFYSMITRDAEIKGPSGMDKRDGKRDKKALLKATILGDFVPSGVKQVAISESDDSTRGRFERRVTSFVDISLSASGLSGIDLDFERGFTPKEQLTGIRKNFWRLGAGDVSS